MGTEQYKIIITPTAFKEINKIYDYISEDLYAKNAARDIMQRIENTIQKLKYAPKIYMQIEKTDELKRSYRRIVIKKYVILYTIDEKNKVVHIVHMYYGGRNYINNNLL